MTKQSAAPRFTQHRDNAMGTNDVINTVFAELAITYYWHKIRFCVECDGEVKPATLNQSVFKLRYQHGNDQSEIDSECRHDRQT